MVKFNEQQQKAIEHKGSHLLVSAGAGSGKTAVTLARVEYLIENGIKPNEILLLSFSRNTVDELNKKLAKNYLTARAFTYHGWSSYILAQEGVKEKKTLPLYMIKNEFKKVDDEVNVEEVLGWIGYQKNYGRTCKDVFIYNEHTEIDYSEEELRTYFRLYTSLLEQNDAWDFEDMLLECLRVLRTNSNKYQYKHILVDEYQDSNLVQNEILDILSMEGFLYCVGDIKQNIYSFRGGDPSYFMEFDENFNNSKVLNLDINYRSKSNVVLNANNFIRPYFKSYKHYSDAIPFRKEKGDIQVFSSIARENEAKLVADMIEKKIKDGEDANEICVLYRLNTHADFLQNELKERGIEYYIDNDSSFFNRKEIRGILAILRLIIDVDDNEAFETIFNLKCYPFTYFNKEFYKKLISFAGTNDISYFEASNLINCDKYWQRKNLNSFEQIITRLTQQYKRNINLSTLIDNIVNAFQLEDHIRNNYEGEAVDERIESFKTLKTFIKGNTLESFITYVYSGDQNKKKVKKDCVVLMSIHKSKGLEFSNVFVIGIESGKFPHKRCSIDEEARLFYVAVTRAKDNLYLSEISTGNIFIEQYKDGMA